MIGSRICWKNTFIRTIYIIEGEISNCQIKLQLELLYNCFHYDWESIRDDWNWRYAEIERKEIRNGSVT